MTRSSLQKAIHLGCVYILCRQGERTVLNYLYHSLEVKNLDLESSPSSLLSVLCRKNSCAIEFCIKLTTYCFTYCCCTERLHLVRNWFIVGGFCGAYWCVKVKRCVIYVSWFYLYFLALVLLIFCIALSFSVFFSCHVSRSRGLSPNLKYFCLAYKKALLMFIERIWLSTYFSNFLFS